MSPIKGISEQNFKKQSEKEMELVIHYEPNPDAFQMREWEILRRIIAYRHGLLTREEQEEMEENVQRGSRIRPSRNLNK